MKINFSNINNTYNQSSTHPRDIFMALPNKSKDYAYPRDVQTEVWNQWFENRNEKNNIIKMNTGSGKTVVGLMILRKQELLLCFPLKQNGMIKYFHIQN